MGRPTPLTVWYSKSPIYEQLALLDGKIAELSVDADEDVDSGVNSAAGATSVEVALNLLTSFDISLNICNLVEELAQYVDVFGHLDAYLHQHR